MSTSSYKSSVLLTRAYTVIRQRAYASLEKYNLNPTQWALIGIVSEAKDGIRASDVSSILGVKPPLVTMLADKLEERDLIKRISNQVDGRAKLLVITSSGKTLASAVEADLVNAFAPLLGGVADEEFAIFQKVLDTIIRNEAVNK